MERLVESGPASIEGLLESFLRQRSRAFVVDRADNRERALALRRLRLERMERTPRQILRAQPKQVRDDLGRGDVLGKRTRFELQYIGDPIVQGARDQLAPRLRPGDEHAHDESMVARAVAGSNGGGERRRAGDGSFG
jgi:hypothetical protein